MCVFSFGFVTFDDIATAKKALEEHEGKEMNGNHIELRYADDRSRDGGRGGRRGGGWGGGE